MPSIKDLKKRIGSVKNTQQTTKAMKMVSAAKLRRAQEAIQNQRPYARRISQLIQILLKNIGDTPRHPLMERIKPNEGDRRKNLLLVVVTSDRGLCGAFNGGVIRATHRWLQQQTDPGTIVRMAFVGRKGYDFFKTKNLNILGHYADLGGKVSFAKAKKLADTLTQLYINEEVDEIKIIYNEFKNVMSQKVVIEKFLPLAESEESPKLQTITGTQNSVEAQQGELNHYVVKPSVPEVLSSLMAKNFSIQTFRILLESQAGEHGARMSAMENATKNAGEMIRKLTLQYNKQRQAGITKELLEIISGSESQKA